jgi:hypothetical protein
MYCLVFDWYTNDLVVHCAFDWKQKTAKMNNKKFCFEVMAFDFKYSEILLLLEQIYAFLIDFKNLV